LLSRYLSVVFLNSLTAPPLRPQLISDCGRIFISLALPHHLTAKPAASRSMLSKALHFLRAAAAAAKNRNQLSLADIKLFILPNDPIVKAVLTHAQLFRFWFFKIDDITHGDSQLQPAKPLSPNSNIALKILAACQRGGSRISPVVVLIRNQPAML
jgi:hypothetical protein